jgi:large subunit ribosomal protein L19
MDRLDKMQIITPRTDLPEFNTGDTIKVHFLIKEGEKQRVQAFEGMCIRKRNSGVSSNFTVRKISEGVGVEKIFFNNSPLIEKIEVMAQGKVRRAKLYYLRDLSGKAARVERRES